MSAGTSEIPQYIFLFTTNRLSIQIFRTMNTNRSDAIIHLNCQDTAHVSQRSSKNMDFTQKMP